MILNHCAEMSATFSNHFQTVFSIFFQLLSWGTWYHCGVRRDWIEWQPDEKRPIRILDLLE